MEWRGKGRKQANMCLFSRRKSLERGHGALGFSAPEQHESRARQDTQTYQAAVFELNKFFGALVLLDGIVICNNTLAVGSSLAGAVR